MSGKRVIDIARGELGYTESPAGSNRTKYGAAYGLDGQPWCVSFLWWCFREAGEAAAFMGGGKTASCGMLFRWYKEMGMTVSVKDVQPGDMVILNFHGTQDTEHCGIVVEVGALGSTRLTTIEGNTSPGMEGSQDNGGCVALKYRYAHQIVSVCRPRYTEEKEHDWVNHWAAKSIHKAIKKGVLEGYPDGSFGPDQSVTRAELCVILDRLGLLE